MEQYKSAYTGAEIDAGIAKANTAIQPEDLGELASKNTVNYETEVMNKPIIPSEVTEETVENWGFTKNTGTYSKPNSGIPKTDLAEDVQTSLGKADTAIQEHQDISGKQNVTDNTLQTNNKTVPNAINEVNSIAKGANQAISYGNYSTMITDFNSLDDDVYKVGQNVYIMTLEVPDLWVSSIESTSSSYTYTTDESFITALETNGYVQVGYYRLSALETQKVDLTNYQTLIDNSHKLDSDLVDDTNATNKFVTDQDKQNWNNKGTYSKPASGIPETDLSQAVQAILEKANATNLSTYEFNEADIGPTVLNYIVDNNPDLLKVTTQQGNVQDYYKGQDREYYCLIGEYFMVLTIEGSGEPYDLDVKSYNFNDIKEVSGTNDGTNWTSITIDGTTKNIPSGGTPQLLVTKVVDTSSTDDQNNPELFFPTLTQLHPGHYYFVTEITGHYGPGNTCNGVIEFTIFNTLDTPGLSEIHFGSGSLAFWQDTNTPPPAGTTYLENVVSSMQTMYDGDDNWGTNVIFDTGYNAQFNNGAVIKVYYKPL